MLEPVEAAADGLVVAGAGADDAGGLGGDEVAPVPGTVTGPVLDDPGVGADTPGPVLGFAAAPLADGAGVRPGAAADWPGCLGWLVPR